MPSFIRPFLPWIAYAVIGGLTDWRWGALAGLLLTGAALASLRRAGRGWDAAVVELGSVGYFAVVAAIALADPDSPLRPWTQGGSSLWLAAVAWGSLLIGRPFTLGTARADVPREYWDSPLFLRVNTVLSAVWAASFTVTGTALLFLRGHDGASLAVTVAGFAVPAVVTARRAAAARRRAETAGAAQAA